VGVYARAGPDEAVEKRAVAVGLMLRLLVDRMAVVADRAKKGISLRGNVDMDMLVVCALCCCSVLLYAALCCCVCCSALLG
jgi:hypothetical protein